MISIDGTVEWLREERDAARRLTLRVGLEDGRTVALPCGLPLSPGRRIAVEAINRGGELWALAIADLDRPGIVAPLAPALGGSIRSRLDVWLYARRAKQAAARLRSELSAEAAHSA